jgi:hypothetical protein
MSAQPDLNAFQALRAYIDSRWPDNNGITIIVELGVKKNEIQVPSRSAIQAAPPVGEGRRRSPLEQAILQVLDELPDGETLTAEQIAESAGYPFNTRIREMLADMVHRHELVNLRPGYRLADPRN